jgi:hypothetical protein
MQSAVHDGRMWVIGGGTYNTVNEARLERTYQTDVWSSKDGASWTREVSTTPWSPRQYHSLIDWDGRLWVIAGYADGANQNGAWYSSNGKDWYETQTPWDPRHAASVWQYHDAVWLAGGGDTDVWRLERDR